LGQLAGQVTGLQTNVQNRVDQLSGEMKSADTRLSAWGASQEELQEQIGRIRREMRTGLEAAGKQSGAAASAMIQRVQAEVASQVDGIRTRLSGLENSRESDRTQVAELQRELTQVRGELAQQSHELSGFRDQVAAGLASQSASTESQIAGVRQSEERNRRQVETISAGLALQRVDFEVRKNRNTDIVPGVSIFVNGIDVPMHTVTAHLWVTPDRRTIRMKSQAVQVPMEYYGSADGKRRELVFTHVTRNSVSGYLLMPAGPREIAQVRFDATN
jgi:chaperonin cofactor prefoldin